MMIFQQVLKEIISVLINGFIKKYDEESDT